MYRQFKKNKAQDQNYLRKIIQKYPKSYMITKEIPKSIYLTPSQLKMTSKAMRDIKLKILILVVKTFRIIQIMEMKSNSMKFLTILITDRLSSMS